MTATEKRQIGMQRNKLLRYKKVKELYNETIKNNAYLTVTTVLEVFIKPVYPISKTTLYNILCTQITSELKELDNKLPRVF